MPEEISFEAQRYCRCLASKQLSAHELDAIPAHAELHCPRDPIIDMNMTISHMPDNMNLTVFRRALEQEVTSATAAHSWHAGESEMRTLRALLVQFCYGRGLGCTGADIRIRKLARSPSLAISPSAGIYSVRVASSKQGALYLAYSMRVDLVPYARDHPTSPFQATSLQLTAVTVSDDIGLSSTCGVFCEAEGRRAVIKRGTAMGTAPACSCHQQSNLDCLCCRGHCRRYLP